MILFGLWLVFLSGGLVKVLGTPGALLAYRLNSLLEIKQAELIKMQVELKRLQAEAIELESNPYVQLREIRKVLGYAAKDELIFDFSTRVF